MRGQGTVILRSDDLHAAIGRSWPAILVSLGIPEEALHGKGKPCPACGGKDRFTFDNRKGRGDFICRGCDAGDGFDLLMRIYGWDFSEARRRVIETAGLAENVSNCALAPEYVAPRTIAVSEPLDWSTRAESIWRKTRPLAGTLGEVYLHHRGCIVPPRDSHLRFLPGDDRYPPSLCAAVTDIRTAKAISLHFTRLAADGRGKVGTDKDKLLLAGHRKRGGVIRLWTDEAVTYGLALAEGIETALSAAHAYKPVWAAIDAGNLAAFPSLPGIEALVIFADGDDAGIDSAAECAERWTSAGKDVLVTFPSKANADMNDEVCA